MAPIPKTLKARKKLSEVNPDNKTGCGANPSNIVDKMMKTAGAYSGTKRKTHITSAAEKTTTKLVHAQFNEENVDVDYYMTAFEKWNKARQQINEELNRIV